MTKDIKDKVGDIGEILFRVGLVTITLDGMLYEY